MIEQPLAHPSVGHWTNAWRRLRHDWVTLAALAVLLVVLMLAIAADVLASELFRTNVTRQDLLDSYAKPDASRPELWLGKDDLGRSQVVRLLFGARISLAVGFGGALISMTLGTILGLLAGFYRGWVDDVLQFVVSTLNAVPGLFLLLVISVLFRPGPVTLVLVLGFLTWPGVSLYARGQCLSLREREFVTAGRVLGASDVRLMFRHLLPNLLPLLLVVAAIDVGTIILAESALSYLGLGINPPEPSWGNMLSKALSDMSRGPWLVWGPGLAIFLTVLCLYLIGDGLRDALDPRLT